MDKASCANCQLPIGMGAYIQERRGLRMVRRHDDGDCAAAVWHLQRRLEAERDAEKARADAAELYAVNAEAVSLKVAAEVDDMRAARDLAIAGQAVLVEAINYFMERIAAAKGQEVIDLSYTTPGASQVACALTTIDPAARALLSDAEAWRKTQEGR